MLPIRPRASHKGDFGRVLIIAGQEGMMGAAILALRGALRSGAGLATVSCDPCFFPIIHTGIPEAICKGRSFSTEDLSTYDSIAIGPGLGMEKKTEALLQMVLENYKGPLILDADALNMLATSKVSTAQCKARLVMTPHEGEAARLLHTDVGTVRSNRLDAARAIASRFFACCVLKGPDTLVVSERGDAFVNTRGNPGMATGGSGDVLTGILAGLSGQCAKNNAPLIRVISAGVYIHGLAGDLAAEAIGEYGLIAGDIAAHVPFAIKESMAT